MSVVSWLSHLWEWLAHEFGEPKHWIIALIVALPAAYAFEYARKRWHLLDRKKIKRGPLDVHAESLVRGITLRKASGRELIRSINWGAHDLVKRATDPDKPSERSLLEAAWSRTSFEEHARVAPSFISPRCTVAAMGGRATMQKGDALAVLIEWLEKPLKVLRGEIRGDTGVGKTTLLQELFVHLVKSNSQVIPILASADNIYQNSDELERLKRETNPIFAFVSVWLKIRRVVGKTEVDQKAMEHAIGTALETGDVVLLLDGVDELRAKGAEEFVKGFLAGVKHWIVTRRYEESVLEESTGHVITLDAAWSRNRILAYVRRRLAGRPEAVERVEPVLKQLISEKDTSSHWLSNPGNLRAYLDEVAPSDRLATTAEMLHLAESAAGLMEKLVTRDMRGIEGADPTEIREALSALALCKLGDVGARREGPVGAKVAQMKTLLRSEGKNLVFRYTAGAEYFLALRLARELLDGPSNWPDAEALRTVADKPWGAARVRLVDESLRTMGATDRPGNIAAWLTASSPIGLDVSSKLAANGKRNVLEVWKKTRSDGESDLVLSPMQNMNFDGMEGRGLNLKNERVESCTFIKADLREAEMMHAQFLDCRFTEADLSSANAIGADFERCSFGEGDQFAKVEGLEIEGIEIVPAELESQLLRKGARSQRSRYRGKFGEQFLKAQQAFLGRAVVTLETKSYVPGIERAIAQAMERRPGEAVYLIDLMAGGHGGRSEELLARFPQLHILSVDRDASQRLLSDRHQWMNREFGVKSLIDPSGTDPFGLGALLHDGFEGSNGKADVVIAKKALHELERRLQPALIQSCGAVLRPAGHLILFVDAPGAETSSVDPAAYELAVQRHEQLRKILLQPAAPRQVRMFFDEADYAADSNGEWLFANDWIAVKDWANLNRHELAHRYFASIGEIREWARPCFGEAVEVQTNWYDINPLRFNERGVNWVLHYLERHNDDRETAIKQNRAMLAEQLAGSDQFHTLVDITRAVLHKSSAFARMMNAASNRVQLADIEPLLAPLETLETAPEFKLKCAVIEFERRL